MVHFRTIFAFKSDLVQFPANSRYAAMSDAEKHELLETLISEIHVYPDQKPSGQWIESIGFWLPILENNFEMSLDKLGGLETVMLLGKQCADEN